MDSCNVDTTKLLSDKRVIAEIQRHQWFESEKAGHDIGFEKAKEDWLKRFSGAWMQYNMPEALTDAKKSCADTCCAPAVKKAAPKAKVAAPKKRRAKSYV